MPAAVAVCDRIDPGQAAKRQSVTRVGQILYERGLTALDCIPGMKGLTTAGGLLRGIKGLASGGLGRLANGARGLAGAGMRTIARSWDGAMLDIAGAARGAGNSRPLTDGVMDALRNLNPRQISRNYTSEQGHYYATRVFQGGRPDGQTVFAGHGYLRQGAGSFVVPEGTSISFYANRGESLQGLDGLAVEAGVYPQEAVQVFHGGDVIEDFTLAAPAPHGPGGFSVFENSTTVVSPTPLSELLTANMGDVHWAACLDLR